MVVLEGYLQKDRATSGVFVKEEAIVAKMKGALLHHCSFTTGAMDSYQQDC
jgi:hypothetical protein